MCAAHSWRRSSASAKAHSRSCAESRPQLAISWLSRKQPIHTCASKKCALYRQMRMHGPLCPFPSSCLDSLGARARPSSALRTVARSRRHTRRDRKFIAGDDGGSHAAPAAAQTIAPAASRTRVVMAQKRGEKSDGKVPRKNQASTQKPKGSLQESVMLGLFTKLTLGERERRSWVRARGTRERCPPL